MRVRGEFTEMPCLRLTRGQAQRLFDLRPDICERVLATLVRDQTLVCGTDGRYRTRRFICGGTIRPRSSNAPWSPQKHPENHAESTWATAARIARTCLGLQPSAISCQLSERAQLTAPTRSALNAVLWQAPTSFPLFRW